MGIADGEFTDQAEGRVWEAGYLQRSGCGEGGHELYMAWAWLRWGCDRGLRAEMEVDLHHRGSWPPSTGQWQVDEVHAGRL